MGSDYKPRSGVSNSPLHTTSKVIWHLACYSGSDQGLANLLVDNFHDIKWNPKAFGRLVLDEAAKRMIYALVNVQKSAGKMDDIIAGKGNGLIILLHGSPGTGKTLTAERCVNSHHTSY